jgi:hypothetical protein
MRKLNFYNFSLHRRNLLTGEQIALDEHAVMNSSRINSKPHSGKTSLQHSAR